MHINPFHSHSNLTRSYYLTTRMRKLMHKAKQLVRGRVGSRQHAGSHYTSTSPPPFVSCAGKTVLDHEKTFVLQQGLTTPSATVLR
jgi:hypothetical protein